jgi:hypothetical protein
MKWLAGHLPALSSPKGAHLLAHRARDSTNAPPTSSEPSHCLSRDGARRSADGVSPSGVLAVDDRRRLAVWPIIDHASPRRAAAEDARPGRIGCRLAEVCIHPWLWVFTRSTAAAFGVPRRGLLMLSGFARPGSRRRRAASRTRPQQVASPSVANRGVPLLGFVRGSVAESCARCVRN